MRGHGGDLLCDDGDSRGNLGELQDLGIVAVDRERFGWLAIIDEETI